MALLPLAALRTFLGYAPGKDEGSKFIRLQIIQGLANAEQLIDLTREGQQLDFTTLQAVYVDNSLNGGVFTMTMQGSGQKIKCPSNSIGLFPVIALSKLHFTVAHAVAESMLDVHLINVPQPYFVYPVL